MADFVGHPFVQALAWTLVHFLWQGAAIWIVALGLMRASRSSSVRYAIGVGALAAMLVVPVGTFFVQMSMSLVADAETALVSALAAASPQAMGDGATAPASISARVPDAWLAAMVALWLAGVVAFMLRLAGGWLVARRVALQSVRPAAASIQGLAGLVAARLGVRRVVTVLESSVVAVPVLVGWLKPVIVLPAAALSGLTPDQLESLIAHELAHVRRHDFVVNLLQSIVEALLFYHPAVWWLSRRVRTEREMCCDDVAVGVCDRLVYAEALKELAAMASPRLALAATDGDLLSRIRRVLGQTESEHGQSARWVPVVIVAATIALVVPATFVIAAPGVREQMRPDEMVIDRLVPTRLVDELHAVEIPLEQPEQATPAVQAERAREEARRQQSEYEALLREYQAMLRRYYEGTDVERMRQLRERGLATASQVEEAFARAQRQDYFDRAAWELADARKKFEMGLITEDDYKRVEQSQADRERQAAGAEVVKRQLQELERLLADRQLREANTEEFVKQQVEAARREAERMKDLVARGLLSQSQLDGAEARLKEVVEAHQKAAEAQKHNLDQHKEELQKKLVEMQHKVEEFKQHQKDRAAEVEAVKRKLEVQVEQALKDRQHVLRERTAEVERLRDHAVEAERLRPTRSRVAVDGPAAAGDLLEIRIGGEPDLPTHYEVRADGSIRVPFLGSFKVVGQTAAQVQAAIGKQLTDRKLGAANQVTVRVLRNK